MSHYGRLLKSVSIYGAGNILLRLVGFITVPIFTRIFSPADYGIIESIGAFISVLSVLGMLGLDSATQRSFFDYSPDQKKERREILSTTFWTLFIWCASLGIWGVLAREQLAQFLYQDSSLGILLALAIAGMPVSVLMAFFQSVLNLLQQPFRYVFVSIIWSVLIVGGSVYLAAVLKLGLFGYYLGVLFGGVISMLVSFWFTRQEFRWSFRFSHLRVMLAYSLPLVPTAAFAWIVQSADRFFLLRYASAADVGYYSLASRLASLLLLVTTAFGTAWSPFFLDLYNRAPHEEPAVRARTLNYLTVALAFCAMALSIYSREAILLIASPSFLIAYRIVGLLAGGVVLLGMMIIIMTGITLSRQTKYFFWGTLLSAAVNTALNFILIPPFAMYGAAIATLLSYACLLLFYLYMAQKLSPAPYKYKKLLIVLMPAVFLTTIGTFVYFDSILLSLILKTMLILAYPVMIWLFGGLTLEEVRLAAAWLASQASKLRGGESESA